MQHPFDDNLYYVVFDGQTATVRRLSFTGNRTPEAVASANQYYGTSPLTVQFSSAGSSDSGMAATASAAAVSRTNRSGGMLMKWLGCLGVLVVIALVIGGVAVGAYNNLVGLGQGVDAQWAQVENQYQRRADLVPNLVATVKGAADFEKSTLEEVVKARASVGQTTIDAKNLPNDPAAFARYQQAQDQLSGALHEARKAHKRARYAVEVLRPLAGGRARRLASRLTAVQDILGRHQDTVVARALLRELGMRAYLDGENGFSYGLLHARQAAAATRTLADLPRARRRAARRRVRRWLD